MEKIFIKNRNNKKICVVVEQPEGKPKGLAFVMHGHGAFKEQPQIVTIADAFKENMYTAVRFDAADTIGESEGDYENSTVTGYYNDLEDLINWSKSQHWYQEPFVLAGSSMGAMCVALYAENYPEKIKALAPKAAVVSGELSLLALDPEKMLEWDKTGWVIEESVSKPGIIKKLNWHNYKQDRSKYNLLDHADKLTMPVLFLVGEKDTVCPPDDQRLLFNKTPGKKEFHIIKGCPHTFREPEHLQELKLIFSKWIKGLN
jgi:pimeloyl-ACP methyl ester carboxylesterase